VLRRPPLGHVLQTAHDMGREYRMITALRDTAVPVPIPIALCEDPEVLGAPFYVMTFVAGTSYRLATELTALGPERTRDISESLIDTLVALHRIDPEAVGLAGFGRPEGYLARQVHRWNTQLRASQTCELPLADELHSKLVAATPASSSAGIVHGDYRQDNVLVDETDRIAAVVDWEMATLGDPLSDLALMLVYTRLCQAGVGRTIGDAPLAPGYLSESQIIDRYARGIGSDLPYLGFHMALACFKLAAILEGINFRYRQGQTVGTGFEQVGAIVEPLLDSGLAAIKELS
jgi:aminoglycoside phosphotransferase (APT) family kinase protein